MLLRHRPSTRSQPRDLVVEIHDPDATVADLASALEPHEPPGPLVVDGRTIAAATPLDRAGIADGAVVGRDPVQATDAESVATLVVTAGFDTGRRVALTVGTHVVGRTPPETPPSAPEITGGRIEVEDPTVSGDHLRVQVAADGSITVSDLGSTNGTTLDRRPLPIHQPVRWEPGSTLACGAARLELAPAPTAHRRAVPPVGTVARVGTRPLHRRHRSGTAPAVEPVEIPPEPDAPPPVTPLGVVAVLGSVAVGVVMVVVLGSLTYAIFALLGPVLLVANAVDSRRRSRRTKRIAGRRRRTQIRTLTHDLEEASAAERSALRSRFGGPVDAVDRALNRTEQIWERRAHHHDAHAVRVATGEVPWQPPTTVDPSSWPEDVHEAVSGVSLTDSPVGLQLRPGSVIAVVGSPPAARSIVRSVLVQAAVLHGPADLQVAILAAPSNRDAWAWCGWLPHVRSTATGSLLASESGAAAELVDALGSAEGDGPLRLVVIDDAEGLAARRSPVRSVLRQADETSRLVPIVLVPDVDAVPANVEHVLVVADDAAMNCGADLATGPAHALGTGEATARDVARVLASFDDPEIDDPGRGLPVRVGLGDLLGADRLLDSVVAARWQSAGPDPSPRAVIGLGAEGPIEIDLAVDGPHALVAGTTGSGKSELLRTLVASLAQRSSPDHLAFVLIDFKGGSAFDACARLPHVTGVVTDLDEHLAERALRCLEAELAHREAVLRRTGADDLAAHRRLADQEPLPRLVVVIDEFATLATEIPDFVDSLVGVAQRGRSLGVHLVLATQRPAGAVSDKIRANTALRVALRVQDRADSTDVIDVADAADLPRQVPGRALVRFGPGELVTAQTALSTARTGSRTDAVTLAPIGFGDDRRCRTADGSLPDDSTPTDLERLVQATRSAWKTLGGATPRPVWPEPLPADLAWTPQSHRSADLVLGLADDPDGQRQVPFAWQPTRGPLLVAGAAGAGTTTALATAVLEVSTRWSAAEAHVHVIDMGPGALSALGDLAVVGQVVCADDHERQRRLIDDLSRDLAARRAAGQDRGDVPLRFLVVDGVGALRDLWDPLEPTGTWDRFTEIVTRGAPWGIHVALSADGPGAIPPALLAACGQRLVMRQADRGDHSAFGVAPAAVPPLTPGRGVASESQLVVQVARPPGGLVDAVAERATGLAAAEETRGPRRIDVLPQTLTVADLRRRGSLLASSGADGTLRVAVGVAEDRLATAHLVLPSGCHALIAGPPRSGRSSTLAAIGQALTEAGIAVVTLDPTTDVDPQALAAIEGSDPVVVLVDDVDLTADDHPLLTDLARCRRPHRHLVVAGRADRLRSRYAHWTREVRVDRCGILLAPDLDLDGELLATRPPRRWPVQPRAGLAWVVGSEPEGVVQIARTEPLYS